MDTWQGEQHMSEDIHIIWNKHNCDVHVICSHLRKHLLLSQNVYSNSLKDLEICSAYFTYVRRPCSISHSTRSPKNLLYCTSRWYFMELCKTVNSAQHSGNLTTVLKNSVFWDVIQCILVEIYWCWRLHGITSQNIEFFIVTTVITFN